MPVSVLTGVDALPDLGVRGARVLFCGLVGECAAARGHHYAGRGDAFWELLHDSGLTPRRLTAVQDELLPTWGIGLTQLVVTPHGLAPGFDAESLLATVSGRRPRWVALNGKRVGREVARVLGRPPPALGLQPWTAYDARFFVLPSSSGANRRRDYDGRPARVDWWSEMAELVRQG